MWAFFQEEDNNQPPSMACNRAGVMNAYHSGTIYKYQPAFLHMSSPTVIIIIPTCHQVKPAPPVWYVNFIYLHTSIAPACMHVYVCGLNVCVCVCVCVWWEGTTHKVSFKAPLVSSDIVLNQAVGAARDSIHCVVTAHDASGISFLDTCLKCGEIGLFRIEHSLHDNDHHT